MSRIGKLPITIPAGVDDGKRIAIHGEGDAGKQDGGEHNSGQ